MTPERTSAAIDWFMRLSEDDVGEGDLSAWIQWCADPDNLREFQAVRGTWHGFDRLGPAASELLETVLKSEVAPSLHSAPAAPARMQTIRRPNVQWPWTLAAAATVIVAVTATLWFVRPLGWMHQDEISARTEMQSTVLPDGSTLTLAPRTNIDVDFSGARRSLQFASGEAHFKVHPDSAKPFVVRTAGISVTAIGTAFDVRSETGCVTVAVQEGSVEVATADANPQVWRVAANHRIAFDTEHRTAHIDAVDLTCATAWYEGRLEYFAAPLSAVVDDLNRYSARSVELGDPQLARLEYTGSVFTGAVDDWLAAIETTFPVRVVVARDGHVVLLNR